MKRFKKAIIDTIMMWFIIFFMTIVFIGGVSDILNVRTQIQEIRKIVQTAVLSASKYYITDKDIVKSEEIATNIIENIPLYKKIEQSGISIEFKWYIDDVEINYQDEIPNNVRASISGYSVDMFWFRLAKWYNYTIDKIEAKANIIVEDLNVVDNFVPIAVNGCTQEFEVGKTYDFLLKSYDLYSDTDNVGFFAVYDPSGGQSSFAHFKNLVDDVMKDKKSIFNIADNISVATVNAIDIKNDVKQIAQSFGISGFPGKDMSIAVVDCGSTADSLIVKRILPIKMNAVFCGKCCAFMGVCLPRPMSMMCVFFDMLYDLTGDVFNDIGWATSVNTCNHNELFRINFEVLSNKDKVILEY